VFVFSTNHKGAIAEAEIAAAAARLKIPVLRPVQDHGRYDMAFEIGGSILRIQCKWGQLDRAAGVIKITLRGARCTPTGYIYSPYAEGEIDLLAAYCAEVDQCYLLPRDLVVRRKQIWLRLSPPRNGQQACINLADDFEFSGAIAQLGERSAGSRKVGGSSPPSSIAAPRPPVCLGAHEFRNRFGYYMERAAAGDEIRVARHGKPFVRLLAA
jgi:prevent-host-death family protein